MAVDREKDGMDKFSCTLSCAGDTCSSAYVTVQMSR